MNATESIVLAETRMARRRAVERGWCLFIRRLVRTILLTREILRAAWLRTDRMLATDKRKRPRQRAAWFQDLCRRALKHLNVQVHVHGPIPSHGLLVANHLGYLDILVLASLMPVRFVAKSEVQKWPLFGMFARWSGSIFVNRSRRSDVRRVNAAMKVALANGDLVGLFPEGTSSDGTTVLPFKTSLLQTAAALDHPLHLAYLSYSLDDGNVGEEICYWKDMTLVPHLWNLLGKRQITARVKLANPALMVMHRKTMAPRLRDLLIAMAGDERANDLMPWRNQV